MSATSRAHAAACGVRDMPSRLSRRSLYCHAPAEASNTKPLGRDHGDVAELADALDLGSSSREGVQVQLLSSPLVFTVFFAFCFSLAGPLLPEVLPTAFQSTSAVASAFWPT